MKSKMRVAMVVGSTPEAKCGVASYTQHLVSSMRDMAEMEVLLVTASTNRERYAVLNSENSEIRLRQWSLAGSLFAARAIRHWRPDILHFQWPSRNASGRGFCLTAMLAKLNCRSKIVLTLHEHMPPLMPTIHMVAYMSDVIISVRQSLREGFNAINGWGARSRRFTYIQSASAIPRVEMSSADIKKKRQEMNVPAEKRLCVFFGLFYPQKGVEYLFDICDPIQHFLVLVGDAAARGDGYMAEVIKKTQSPRWNDSCRVLGFLSEFEIAQILRCADAVVLPFRDGGGPWNTSILAARNQGTFVLTTSTTEQGYNVTTNVFSARPGDVDAMRNALQLYAGRRVESDSGDIHVWKTIAERHFAEYCKLTHASKEEG
jgi:glycosyltransferase involved in cell wall biosynthesis